jgi:hypothetical protein
MFDTFDLFDKIDRRLGLSVQRLDGGAAGDSTGNEREC